MAKKVQLQTNGKEWRNGQYVDIEKRDIDPITSSSCVQIEGFRTLEEAVSDNKMLSQDLTYTKVMDKVGGDYHQNVLDGQYSKAILYGNTQVNLCEEDSSVALQIPTTFTSFNNSELQINNKENQVVAPLIKGVTMVNLAQTHYASITSGSATTIQNVKGNTVYTLSFKFTTKNTNSGITIQCYDGDGTFIENTMHKTGLGDDVKFTFTTHANATKVHVCNNPAYGGETIQLDEIMLIEGDQTALDIPFFKGMKSVELVRPLTNLFTDTITTYEAGATATNSSGNITVTSKSSSSWSAISFKMNMLKNNTKYLVMWDSLNTTQTSTSNTEQLIGIYYVDTSSQNIGIINNNTLCPTRRSLIFDTKDFDVAKIWLKIHATLNNTETGTTTVTGLRVFEYDDYLHSVDLQSIGYFSGTKNVAVEPIKTCSKNLYPYGDINFTPTSTGWFDAKGNSQMTGDIASKSHSRFLLKKGTYYFSIESNTNAFCQLTDDKENMGVNANSSFTLQEDKYVTLRVKVTTANTSTTVTNIQIERGETATDYVAHDSRYYEPNGQNTIVLRSLPSGVCDTFNLQTGEYVQRINEVVFNGSEDENWNAVTISPWTENGYYTFEYLVQTSGLPTYDANNGIYVICDKFNSIVYNTARTDAVGILLYDSQGKKVAIKQKEYTTLDEWKQYLQQNPITVQYQLATPIKTIIPRTIKCNNNGTVSTVDFGTYTNKESLVLPSNPSYLTINSMTSIKPVVEPITYLDFKTRLKANTDYSVKLDKNTDSQLSFKIGGVGTKGTYFTMNSTEKQKIAKTPTLDVNNVLRISGSGYVQNIMVIEGNVLDKELPYFNGMCNVKMPIVRNTGKNLCNFDEHKSNWWINSNGLDKGDNTANSYSVIIPASVNNYYTVSMIGTNRNIYGFLDKDYNVIYFNTNNINTTIKAPSNTRYLIWYLSSTGLTKENNIMITASKSSSMTTIPYEPYKGNDICIAQGEIGLSQDMFEIGAVLYGRYELGTKYEIMKSNDYNYRVRLKDLISIKPDTVYNINISNDKYKIALHYFDTSGGSIQKETVWIGKSCSIKTPIDAYKVSILLSYKNDSQITLSTFDFNAYQLLELDSTVQLRSLPNGVKDELNLLTGEYIQRVGEVIFDGSEDENWQLNNTESTTTKRFIIGNLIGSNVTNDWNGANKYVCDKLNKYLWSDTVEFGITVINNSAFLYNNNIDYSIGALKTWLSQNPITVQYELAEPIISYPRIVSNTQEREVGVKLPNGVCDTYNPSTGITIKRVGFIEFNGSDNENWQSQAQTSYQTNVITCWSDLVLSNLPNNRSLVVTNQIQSIDQALTTGNYQNIENCWISSTGRFNMNIATSKLGGNTIALLKTYLSQNPLKVWYELANPVVTTDIVLPNGVHDDYNPITGLYTKRIGFIELDGGETNLGYRIHSNGYLIVDIDNIKLSGLETEPTDNILSNILVNSVSNIYQNTDITTNCIALHHQSTSLMIKVMNISTVDEYKTYLSQNPIKVWYELATPITYQLTPYFGLPMPYAYKDGHLIMDSAYDGQSLPPEFKYQVLTNRTGQITQNNIKLKEHTARLSNLEYILIEATLDSIFDREMQNFELELMNIELLDLDE